MNQTQGATAEAKVCEYLCRYGHIVLAKNWRTRSAEIDIISRHQKTIYFTEVKYRRTNMHGHAFEYVTAKKLRQMHIAARQYMATHPELSSFRKSLLVAAVSGPHFVIELIEVV